MTLLDFGFGMTQSFGGDTANSKTRTGSSAPTAPGTQFQAPAPLKPDAFSRPGDSFGDSQMREQNYSGLLKQAATGSGMTKNQRAAMLQGANGLLAPGLAHAELQQKDAAGQQGIFQQAIQSGYLPGSPPALPDPTKPADDAAPDQPQFPPAMMDFLKRFREFNLQQANLPPTGLSTVSSRMD